MSVMPFGRYRGRSLATIPKLYLRWLLRQPGVRPDLRAAIKHRLGMAVTPVTAERDYKLAQAGDDSLGDDFFLEAAAAEIDDWMAQQQQEVA